MSKLIATDDFLAAAIDCFDNDRQFSFAPTGDSMKPTINGTTDKVVLSKKPQILKKYDVVLYKRPSGALVLHRIVGFLPDGTYVMSGDSHYYYEYGISYDDIVAIVTSIYRHDRGTIVNTTDFSYIFSSRILVVRKKTRILLSKIYHRFVS